jgi:uncharacterized membrane protein
VTMQVERPHTTAVPLRPGQAPRRGDPPGWLIAGLLAGYVIALAALAFWPGATLLDRLRALDGGICAQLPSHSFFPGGERLPLCSRNTGIYTGFALTVTLLFATRRSRVMRLPGLGVLIPLGIAVVAMGVDGFNSLFLDLHLPHLYQPANPLRLATGLGMGTAMAAVVVPVVNGLLWRDEDTRSSFDSLGQLALMLPILSVAFVAVATQAAFLLYPVALLSSAGLVTALTLVNLVFMLGLANRIGRYTAWRQVLPVFSVALVLAVVELLALFVLKSFALQALAA